MINVLLALSVFLSVHTVSAQVIDWENPTIVIPGVDLTSIRDGLKLEERKAINVYTSGKYELINGALRGTYQATPEIKNLISLISSGLNKLAPYRGEVYRYSYLKSTIIKSKYQAGKTVKEPFFVSTSETREGTKIDRFLSQPPLDVKEEHVFFVIQSLKGKDIEPYSVYQFEKEILFNKGTSFHIKSVSKDRGYLRIEMLEIP